MAKIKELPPYTIISSLRGIIDYCVWRGINVVRMWPDIHWSKNSETEAWKRTSEAMKKRAELWHLMMEIEKEGWKLVKRGLWRSYKDYADAELLKMIYKVGPERAGIITKIEQKIIDEYIYLYMEWCGERIYPDIGYLFFSKYADWMRMIRYKKVQAIRRGVIFYKFDLKDIVWPKLHEVEFLSENSAQLKICKIPCPGGWGEFRWGYVMKDYFTNKIIYHSPIMSVNFS